MSRQNKVNKNNYTQRGRLTPDEMAHERVKQREISGRGAGKENIVGKGPTKPAGREERIIGKVPTKPAARDEHIIGEDPAKPAGRESTRRRNEREE